MRALQRWLRAPWHDALRYDRSSARRDFVAGLTVALVAVPQSIAYAMIAGVPPQVGLYTLVVQSAVSALVCSQPLLSAGPINTQSLLVAAIATRVVAASGSEGVDPTILYLQIVVALTFLKGVVQLTLAAGGLGNLVRYVSEAVILGFTAGAGVLIAAGQLAPFLGVEIDASAPRWPGLAGVAAALATAGGELRPTSVAVGVSSLALLLVLRRIASPLLPGPLLAVVAGGALVFGLGLTAAELPLVGPLPAGLPSLAAPWPPLALVEPLLGGALALALLGLMEAYSVGKTLATRTGTRISASHELFGQGVTNLVSSFAGCMPGSGSFSRSTLNHRAGAATRFSGLFNAGIAALLVLIFAPLAAWIPRASLAAVLFVIAWELVDWRALLRMARASRSDAVVGLVTFGATLTVPLAWAVFVGVLLNLALYLQRASRLHLAEMTPAGGGRFVERPLREGEDAATRHPIVFLQLQGDLFFGQADELADRLAALTASGARIVVIRLKRTLSIDSTILAVLDRFAAALAERGGQVIVCGVAPGLCKVLRAYGFVDRLGEDCFFEATPGVFASARRALERAHELAGSGDAAAFEWTAIDEEELSDLPETDPAREEPPPQARRRDF